MKKRGPYKKSTKPRETPRGVCIGYHACLRALSGEKCCRCRNMPSRCDACKD